MKTKTNKLAEAIATLIASGLNNKEICDNLPQSKKYQVGPTRWDLIAVIRQLMTAPELDKLYVVVTTDNDGERDLFADVVLITRDKAKAEKVEEALKGWLIGGTAKDKDRAALKKLGVDVTHLSTPICGWATIVKEIDGSF